MDADLRRNDITLPFWSRLIYKIIFDSLLGRVSMGSLEIIDKTKRNIRVF